MACCITSEVAGPSSLAVSPGISQLFFLCHPHSLANSFWAASLASSGFVFQQLLQEDGSFFSVIADDAPRIVLVSLLGKQGRIGFSHLKTYAA